jgi:hypothetical protein
MTTIFECETEVARCACVGGYNDEWKYAEPEYATLFARTVASIHGQRRTLRIEQHCFVRGSSEVTDQPWIKPVVLIEPVSGSQTEMLEMARALHEKLVERARVRLPQTALA